MVINQGDLYWVELGIPIGSAPGYRRPHVVVQNNYFNHGRLNTVVVCGLTTNSPAPERRATYCCTPVMAGFPKTASSSFRKYKPSTNKNWINTSERFQPIECARYLTASVF